MEFDQGISCAKETDRLMDVIKQKWETHGYKLPKLSFWNVCGRTMTIPQIKNDNGIRLISGFSPVVIKQVLSDYIDPMEALKEVLLSERYEEVTLMPMIDDS